MRFCPSCGARYEQDIGFCPDDGSPTREVPDEGGVDPLVGQVIDGRYRIEEPLGEGGMGIVYVASHVVLGKKIAIKVLRGEMARDADLVARFTREAQSASSIGHPNIIDVSDIGQLPDGTVYFAMEYLVGRSLSEHIVAEGSLSVEDAIEVTRQIGSALAAAHALGIVHRDLKPDNVFLPSRADGTLAIKVLDFGIAKVGGAKSKLTQTGTVVGTPHYMSPEQASGQSVDARTDIYALGIIMYEMVTGRVPFDADTFMGILTKQMFEPPVPPSEVRTDTDLRGFDAVILRALAKTPDERYATMEELLTDVDKVEGGEGQTLKVVPMTVPGRPAAMPGASDTAIELPRNRMPLALLAGIGAVLLLGGGLTAAVVAFGGEAHPETAATAKAAPEPALERDPVTREDAGASAAPEARVSEVRIVTEPAGAQVFVGGAVVANTPVSLPRPKVGETRTLTLVLRDHERQTVELSDESPDELTITLDEKKKPAIPRRAHVRRRAPPKKEEPPPKRTAPKRRTGVGSEVMDPWAN